MTNSTFSPGAIQLAAATNVLLWDRSKLDELISKAGGLEELGLCPRCDDFDTIDVVDEIDDDFDDALDVDEDNIAITSSNPPQKGTKVLRKGMRILSRLCIGWSVICILLLLIMIGDEQNRLAYVGVFIGIGLFSLVFGLMFDTLSKSERYAPYMFLGRKAIKKSVFIIMCIVIAYVLFFGTIGVTGGLST